MLLWRKNWLCKSNTSLMLSFLFILNRPKIFFPWTQHRQTVTQQKNLFFMIALTPTQTLNIQKKGVRVSFYMGTYLYIDKLVISRKNSDIMRDWLLCNLNLQQLQLCLGHYCPNSFGSDSPQAFPIRCCSSHQVSHVTMWLSLHEKDFFVSFC